MPPELVDKLTAWAEFRGVTKSEAVRLLLAEALGAEVPKKTSR